MHWHHKGALRKALAWLLSMATGRRDEPNGHLAATISRLVLQLSLFALLGDARDAASCHGAFEVCAQHSAKGEGMRHELLKRVGSFGKPSPAKERSEDVEIHQPIEKAEEACFSPNCPARYVLPLWPHY